MQAYAVGRRALRFVVAGGVAANGACGPGWRRPPPRYGFSFHAPPLA